MSTILALGFRADTGALVKELEAIVGRHGLNAAVVGRRSKYETKNYLDAHASQIPGTAFEVDTDGNWAPEDADRPWPQYESDDIRLFACSTVTREDTDEYASTLYDGEEFAKLLMPRTPKLILHFQNEHRRDAGINAVVLQQDFETKVYHLPRIKNSGSVETSPSSVTAMDALVKELFENDMKIPFDVYMRILKSATSP